MKIKFLIFLLLSSNSLIKTFQPTKNINAIDYENKLKELTEMEPCYD